MRGWIVLWVVAAASIASGCAPAPPDSTEEVDESGCSSLRVYFDSPAEDEIVGTWSTQVSGRVEGDVHLLGLHYEVDGHGLGIPAIAGPFSFTAWTDRRPEVRVAVQARSVDGCVVRAERVIRFDTSRWVELMQEGDWVEMNVAAPGEEVLVHWKPTRVKGPIGAPDARELVSGRYVSLGLDNTRTGEGSFALTVENRDLEVWWITLGVNPGLSRLAISVGRSLEIAPSHVEVGVGDSQWLSITNALDAEWSVEPAAVLEPEPAGLAGLGIVRAGARFEAERPGTYKVRATTADGKRVGEATIVVKAVAPPRVTTRDLPSFPSDFSPHAVVALPDGSLVAGGHRVYEAELLRLQRDGDAWSSYAEVGAESGITHLVVGDGGELYALADSVLRISPEGAVERILDSKSVSRSIVGIWLDGGVLYAVVGFDRTYVFDPAAGAWTEVRLLGACPNLVLASDAHGRWHACMGQTRIVGPENELAALAPVSDLALDAEGRLLAATSKGVHRFSRDGQVWDHLAGGGPAEAGTMLLWAGQRLFAGNHSGLWTFVRSDRSWARVHESDPLFSWRYFVSMPNGAIVTGNRFSDSGPVELTVEE